MIFKNNLLSRYLFKELLNATVVMTVFLVFIFLSQQIIRLLSYAAAGKLALNVLLQVIGFELLYLLSLLLPLGFYLATVWTYGSLYINHELEVMHASGFSIKRLFYHTMFLGVIVMIGVGILMLWVNPWIAKEKERILAEGRATDNLIETILPGRFQVSKDGKRVLYVEKILRDRSQAENVFIANQKLGEEDAEWSVISAAKGYQTKDHDSRFLVTENGNRYEGIPGQKDYKVIQFKRYQILVPASPLSSKHEAQEAILTKDLIKDYSNKEKAAELQWRLSIPFSVILLAMLGVPLSHVRPRQGRYLSLFTAVLIYIVYVNLLFVGRNWVDLGFTSNMGWVHLFLGMLILGFFIRRYQMST